MAFLGDMFGPNSSAEVIKDLDQSGSMGERARRMQGQIDALTQQAKSLIRKGSAGRDRAKRILARRTSVQKKLDQLEAQQGNVFAIKQLLDDLKWARNMMCTASEARAALARPLFEQPDDAELEAELASMAVDMANGGGGAASAAGSCSEFASPPDSPCGAQEDSAASSAPSQADTLAIGAQEDSAASSAPSQADTLAIGAQEDSAASSAPSQADTLAIGAQEDSAASSAPSQADTLAISEGAPAAQPGAEQKAEVGVVPAVYAVPAPLSHPQRSTKRTFRCLLRVPVYAPWVLLRCQQLSRAATAALSRSLATIFCRSKGALGRNPRRPPPLRVRHRALRPALPQSFMAGIFVRRLPPLPPRAPVRAAPPREAGPPGPEAAAPGAPWRPPPLSEDCCSPTPALPSSFMAGMEPPPPSPRAPAAAR
eukprot:TRINITY_DN1121_c0_g1_i4.p1 TRINITY_DN1121_c0_g1~~TRINITY_DN1121_c0_g1_i4.p1  ORF type:complete len:458 (+),score=136.46 TRINITY_DN1121_c0_g1_i4:99-1376(+)